MTELMISAATGSEAAAAIAGGVTVVDARSGSGIAAVPPTVLRSIAAAAPRFVASAGLDASLNQLEDLIVAGSAAIHLAVPAGEVGTALVTHVGRALATRARLIAVVDAVAPDIDVVPIAAVAGFAGVQFDLFDETKGLLATRELADIARMVAAARRARLAVGLGGGLRLVDVGTLLPLKPDWLRFRAAACEDESPTRPVDPARVRALATAIAVHETRLRDDGRSDDPA